MILYYKINKLEIFKKGIAIGIAIKVRKQVASYLAKKLLATYTTGSIGYYLCLLMQTQFQLGGYIHAPKNETHSLANLQDLFPTLASLCFL